MRVEHTIEPFFPKNAKILILGTIPSPKSRETGFYYGHQQNRFWKVLAKVFNENVPEGIEDKKQFLQKYGIALWDVLSSCEIDGASDASISSPEPNPILEEVEKRGIVKIYATGKTAHKLLKKLCGIDAVYLPSPSPANCAVPFESLASSYSDILNYLK